MADIKPIYVNIPCPTKDEAVRLCAQLLEKDLCGTAKIQENVNLMYMTGEGLQNEAIVLMVLKTTDTKLTAIHEFILKNHSWGTPCIEVVALTADVC